MPYISSRLGTQRAQTQILRTLRYNNGRQQHPGQRQLQIVDSARTTRNDPALPTLALPLGRRLLQPLQQIQRHRLGPCTVICLDCNALHWIEEKCRTNAYKFSTCCMNGAISLPQLPPAPTFMEQLLKDESNGNYRGI